MVSGSMGGRLSLLAPYDDTAGLLHGWGRDGKEADMEHRFCLVAHHHRRNCCRVLLFMQAPIKPGYLTATAPLASLL